MMGYGPDWGMMGEWGGGTWWGPIGMIIPLLFLVVIIAGVVWLARAALQSSSGQVNLPRRSPGLDALEERYARGEIDREEYLKKKCDISG